MSNKHKNPTIRFRGSVAERRQIEARILASGLMKKDYFVRSCIYNRICVVGKKETIYPLLKFTQELYHRLVSIRQEITPIAHDIIHIFNNNNCDLPSKHDIIEPQEDFTNMLNAITKL